MCQLTGLERAYARSLTVESKADQQFRLADQHFQTNPSIAAWIKRQTAQKKLFAAHQRVLDTRKQWAKQIDKILKNEVLKNE